MYRTVIYENQCKPTELSEWMGISETTETLAAKFQLYDDGWRLVNQSSSFKVENEPTDFLVIEPSQTDNRTAATNSADEMASEISHSRNFEGCYFMAEKGSRPDIKITNRSKGIFVAMRTGDKWDEDVAPLVSPTESQLEEFFGSKSSEIEDSLVSENEPFGIFRLKSNSKIEHKSPESDYMMFLLIALGPAFKTSCN